MKLYTIFSAVLVMALLAACAPPAVSPTAAPSSQKPGAAKPALGVWENLVEQARKEGKVMVYTNLSQDARANMSKAISDKYGIEMEFYTAGSGQLVEKIVSEKRAGMNLVDMTTSGPSSLQMLKKAGALSPIPPLLVLPEMTDPKVWPKGQVPYLDEDKSILALLASLVLYVITNSDVIKPSDLTAAEDLLKPQYKGKIVMYNPTRPGSSSNWVAYIMHEVMGMEKGRAYMKQLATQDLAFTDDYRQLIEWVAKGKYPIGIGGSQQIVFEFQKAGAPVIFARMKEGGIMHPGETTMAMPKDPAHPQAAKLLLNWLLTSEGQLVLGNAVGKSSFRLDTRVQGLEPSGVPQPGDKVYQLNEKFIDFTVEVQTIAKDIFGASLGK